MNYKTYFQKVQGWQPQNISAMLHKWLINDSLTQSIRTEIIIDMLISEFIESLVATHLKVDVKDVELLAKEFPIRSGEIIKYTNDGEESLSNANVDFLLKVKDVFYLTELKTTNASLNSKQLKRMVCVAKNQYTGAKSDQRTDMWDFYNKILQSKSAKTADGKKYHYTQERIESVLPDFPQKLKSEYKACPIRILYILLYENDDSRKFMKKCQEYGDLVENCLYLEKYRWIKDTSREKLWRDTYKILKEVSWIARYLEGEKTLPMDEFDQQVYEIYQKLRQNKAEDFPGIAKHPFYRELFDAAQDTESEDFIEFLSLFEVLGYYLTGGEDKNAPFFGRTMEDLPDLVLQDMVE